MYQRIKELFFKYKEVISYLFFGVLTTAVDFLSYLLFTRVLSMGDELSNIIAQVVAILFAVVTNKLFVVVDKTDSKEKLFGQFLKFVSLRTATLILNAALFRLLAVALGIHDIIAKALVSVLVIILNYVFSKLIVFKSKEKKK